MIAKNCTFEQMNAALEAVNKLYDGNIKFRRLDSDGKHIRFTLTVYNSRGKGSRLSASWNGSQRHISAACWHVHGEFFDSLFIIAPEAEIISTGENGKIKITSHGGNWEDRNIGSNYRPFYYSQACEC